MSHRLQIRRPRRRNFAGLGLSVRSVRWDDAPPNPPTLHYAGGNPCFNEATGQNDCIKIPLPGGGSVNIGVQPPVPAPNAGPAAGAPGGLVPAGAVDKVKTWMQAEDFVAGWKNWQVAGGAAVLLMILKK